MKLLLKLFGAIMWIYLVLNGISFLIRQKGFDLIAYVFYPPEHIDIWAWNLIDVPYWVSFVMSILYLSLPIFTIYLLWTKPEIFFCLSREKNDIKVSYFNIDLIPHNDTQWINELKQEKRSKKMIAYSKKGARAARIKAIELGLKDVFVDFVSDEEADKRR
jgi:hypothetical protein